MCDGVVHHGSAGTRAADQDDWWRDGRASNPPVNCSRRFNGQAFVMGRCLVDLVRHITPPRQVQVAAPFVFQVLSLFPASFSNNTCKVRTCLFAKPKRIECFSALFKLRMRVEERLPPQPCSCYKSHGLRRTRGFHRRGRLLETEQLERQVDLLDTRPERSTFASSLVGQPMAGHVAEMRVPISISGKFANTHWAILALFIYQGVEYFYS